MGLTHLGRVGFKYGGQKRKVRRYLSLYGCECGKTKILWEANVRYGQTKSCGCLKEKMQSTPELNPNYRHGYASGGGKRLYSVYNNMLGRCNNPGHQDYQWYGGKGVEVEWLDFIAFKDWAEGNGYRDDLTIDRIDPDGNYCPENCQWVTPSENFSRAQIGRWHGYAELAQKLGKEELP